MPEEWYCEFEEGRCGPVSPAQLREMAAAGRLKPTTWIWQVGMKTMVAAGSVEGLFAPVPAATPTLIPLAMPVQAAAPGPIKTEDLIELTAVGESLSRQPVITLEIAGEPTGSDRGEVEVLEAEEDEAPEPVEEDEPEILAEASVTYREGLPDVKGPVVATLCLETAGLRFVFEEDDFYVPFERVDNVREPSKGDFPEEMKKKARSAKVGAKMGKLASGLLGAMIGDTAGDLVSKAGGEAARAVEENSELGKVPRNRITVNARLRKQRRKIRFDVNGLGREQMTEEARVLFKKINRTREKYAKADAEAIVGATVVENEPDEPDEPEEELGGFEYVQEAPLTAAPVLAAPVSGKLYRVRIGDRVQGPYSLNDLRRLLASDRIADDDLISIETWVSAGAMRELFGAVEKDAWSQEGRTDHGGRIGTARQEEGVLPVDDELML